MGLFGKRKQKQQTAQQQRPAMEVRPWAVPPATWTYRMPADHEATIYTYDGEPLRGMKSGDRFVAVAVPADVTMVSAYTGAVASSAYYGNVAYEYRGRIFGMGPSHSEAIAKLMRNGYRVEVEAYVNGYDGEKGYPRVCGLYGFVDDLVYNGLK